MWVLKGNEILVIIARDWERKREGRGEQRNSGQRREEEEEEEEAAAAAAGGGGGDRWRKKEETKKAYWRTMRFLQGLPVVTL